MQSSNNCRRKYCIFSTTVFASHVGKERLHDIPCGEDDWAYRTHEAFKVVVDCQSWVMKV